MRARIRRVLKTDRSMRGRKVNRAWLMYWYPNRYEGCLPNSVVDSSRMVTFVTGSSRASTVREQNSGRVTMVAARHTATRMCFVLAGVHQILPFIGQQTTMNRSTVKVTVNQMP